MGNVLIIFARAPEVGRCKTRLIPALGAVGATELHTQMTQRTLAWARRLAAGEDLTIEVHYSGGSAPQMAATFGDDLQYIPQVAGDLGDRLKAAICKQRAVDSDRIVVVGTDCPQLTVGIGKAAFERLTTHSICLAPATDGGYVLIGVNAKLMPAAIDWLFEGIDWGGSQVLSQTLAHVNRLAASCAVLPTLQDVDTPDELQVWYQAVRDDHVVPPDITVVIPTYNQEAALADTIASARSAVDSEIIVVAGGQFQHSIAVAAMHAAQCVVSSANRGWRMNQGANIAHGQILLFVHADTRLPAGYQTTIKHLMADATCVAGAFQLQIASTHPLARGVERAVRWRSQWRSLPYGDQGIFVRRDVFQKLGGFCDQPIMEDYEFIRRLRRIGVIAMAQEPVQTSARRWERRGFVRTTLINQCMLLGYHLGIPTSQLAAFYRRK